MADPVIIDELSPSYIGEDRFGLALNENSQTPAAFSSITIDVDYSGAEPEGVVLPLELIVQAPSASGFVRRFYTRTAPSSVIFRPAEGGLHLVMLREVGHNRWWGRLRVQVDGDQLEEERPV
jgi:hypothetical protein